MNTSDFNPVLFRESETGKAPWYHFSIDDIFESLIEVTDRKIALFEHPLFAFLLHMHTRFGVCVALYLFYKKNIDGKERTLSEVRSLHDELAKHSWLRFAPHALDFDTMPFNQDTTEIIRVYDDIYNEIERITGSTNNHASWARLHFYAELYELGDYFKKRGVSALFTTDRPVGSHRMPQEVAQKLLSTGSATYQGTNFIRTQFRAEFFTADRLTTEDIKKQFASAIKTYGYVILYTHEYELVRSEVRHMLEKCFEALDELSVKSLKEV